MLDENGSLIGTELGGRYRLEKLVARSANGSVFIGYDRVMDRRVAIKLLAEGKSEPARQAQFEREARINGALPHPNVVAAFDIGRHEGNPFLVTELLQGMTLRARISEGPVPTRLAVDFALQLARGLASAHAQGVVHCDLKPENVFVTRDGWIKILDFGIARIEAADSTDSEEPSIPAVRGFCGTSGYAAPEQLDGGEPDLRWDVFAYGAIVCELATGVRAFPGVTRDQRREATRRGAPKKLTAALPGRLRKVVKRCLSLDPTDRYPSARELLAALEGAKARRTLELRTALLLFAVTLAVATATYNSKHSVAAAPVFRQITFHPGAVWTARFSTDGRRVYYTESWDGSPPRLFSTRLDQEQGQRLELDRAVLAALSPSGELGVLSRPHFEAYDYTGTFSVVPASGGAAREVLEAVDYADFSPDGAALAVVRREGSSARLEFPAGHLLYETPGWLSHPRVSPRGDSVAFFDHPRLNEAEGALAVVSRDGLRQELASDLHSAEGLAWSPSGDEVWFTATDSDDQAQQPALRAVTLSGEQRLLSRVPGNLKLQDVARDGRVLATQPQNYLGLTLTDLQGAERDLSWLDQPALMDLTPDGSKVLFAVIAAGGRMGSLFVRNTDGSPPVRLSEGRNGALSADGRWVAAVATEGERQPILLIPTGPGQTRELPAAGLTAVRSRFFPDGKRLLVAAAGLGKGLLLYVRDVEGGVPVAISAEGMSFHFFTISPDNRTIAAQEADRHVVLLDADGAIPRRLVPAIHAGEVPWGWLSASLLLVGTPLEVPAHLYAIDVRSGMRSLWTTLTPHAPGAFAISRILVASDGKMIAYNHASAKTHLYLLDSIP